MMRAESLHFEMQMIFRSGTLKENEMNKRGDIVSLVICSSGTAIWERGASCKRRRNRYVSWRGSTYSRQPVSIFCRHRREEVCVSYSINQTAAPPPLQSLETQSNIHLKLARYKSVDIKPACKEVGFRRPC